MPGTIITPGGAGGPALAGTAPPAINANSLVGSGTDAAKGDHTHAGVATFAGLTGDVATPGGGR